MFCLRPLKYIFVNQEKQMMVYVERRVADEPALIKDESFGLIRNQLCTFREGEFPLCPVTLRRHKYYNDFISFALILLAVLISSGLVQ